MQRKKSKASTKRFILFLILLLITVISISTAAATKTSVIVMKNENVKLLKEINDLKQNNKKIKSETEEIQSQIKVNQKLYSEKTNKTKIAYLTFDDGPSNNTLKILEILKSHDIKATFFVNGHENLRDYYKKIHENGHVIANHTYSHDYKTIYKSTENFQNDVKKLDNFITEATGSEPSHIIRFPGGSNNTVCYAYGGRDFMKKLIPETQKAGYIFFDWNVDSSDASTRRQSKEKIVNSVLTQSKNKNQAVILMHDLDPKTTTVEALPEIIEGLKSQGFSFDSLSKDSPKCEFVTSK